MVARGLRPSKREGTRLGQRQCPAWRDGTALICVTMGPSLLIRGRPSGAVREERLVETRGGRPSCRFGPGESDAGDWLLWRGHVAWLARVPCVHLGPGADVPCWRRGRRRRRSAGQPSSSPHVLGWVFPQADEGCWRIQTFQQPRRGFRHAMEDSDLRAARGRPPPLPPSCEVLVACSQQF